MLLWYITMAKENNTCPICRAHFLKKDLEEEIVEETTVEEKQIMMI